MTTTSVQGFFGKQLVRIATMPYRFSGHPVVETCPRKRTRRYVMSEGVREKRATSRTYREARLERHRFSQQQFHSAWEV